MKTNWQEFIGGIFIGIMLTMVFYPMIFLWIMESP
jgi:hypothetical protein